jgi:hypothetical protein
MPIVDSLARACDRFDEVRSCLRWATSVEAAGSAAELRSSRELRASAFVAISGSIEQFFKEFVESLGIEVSASGATHDEIGLSLHAIVSSQDFRALQTLRDAEKMLHRRILLLERTVDQGRFMIRLAADELGLSGETIRAAHVNTVWRLFGLPGNGFESIGQQVSLRVFADNRNDYAHGKVPINQFLQNPECNTNRILERIAELEEWLFHCWQTADLYFSNQMYKR